MDTATGAVIGSVVTAVLGALVAAWVNFSRERHQQNQATHGTTIEEYRDLVSRLEEESIRHQQAVHKCRERCDICATKLSYCYQSYARAEERICTLEDLLEANKVPFRRWVPRTDLSDASMDVQP